MCERERVLNQSWKQKHEKSVPLASFLLVVCLPAFSFSSVIYLFTAGMFNSINIYINNTYFSFLNSLDPTCLLNKSTEMKREKKNLSTSASLIYFSFKYMFN